MQTRIFHLHVAGQGKFSLFDNDMNTLTRGFVGINLISQTINENTPCTVMVYTPHDDKLWDFYRMIGVKHGEKFEWYLT